MTYVKSSALLFLCFIVFCGCECKQQQTRLRTSLNEAESIVGEVRGELEQIRAANKELADELQSVNKSNKEYAEAYKKYASAHRKFGENSRKSLERLESLNTEGEGTLREIFEIIDVLREVHGEIRRIIQEFNQIEPPDGTGP